MYTWTEKRTGIDPAAVELGKLCLNIMKECVDTGSKHQQASRILGHLLTQWETGLGCGEKGEKGEKG